MKPVSIVAVLLILIGIAGLVSGQISYTTKEQVLDIGPIQASVKEKHVISIPEAAGVIAIVGGIVLLVVGFKRA